MQRDRSSIVRLCRLYQVSRAGFYAWQRRQPSRHARRDQQLQQQIAKVFHRHAGRYGSPRIHRELQRTGWRVSRRRVERLMRAAGLRGRVARVYRANAPLHRFFDQHPHRLARQAADRPDQVWVGDITYIPVAGRWHFLAVVLDQCSRRLLAWALGDRRDSPLTCRVFNAALRRRRPPAQLIFHSDRGSEYVGGALRARLQALGLRQSSTRRGPEDNAHMESFFHSLRAELLHGLRFATVRETRDAIRQYVRYYNHERLHSALKYQTPVAFERVA